MIKGSSHVHECCCWISIYIENIYILYIYIYLFFLLYTIEKLLIFVTVIIWNNYNQNSIFIVIIILILVIIIFINLLKIYIILTLRNDYKLLLNYCNHFFLLVYIFHNTYIMNITLSIVRYLKTVEMRYSEIKFYINQ